MYKEFIPYEQALALKELGFDESCLAYYADGVPVGYKLVTNFIGHFTNSKLKNGKVSAPLYQQAFRWFREKHGYYQSIEIQPQYNKWLSRWCNIDGSMGAIALHDAYPESELACLIKLIEIVKQKQ